MIPLGAREDMNVNLPYTIYDQHFSRLVWYTGYHCICIDNIELIVCISLSFENSYV